VDLSLASKDADVSFLQQVTIERPKSNGSSRSEAAKISRCVEISRA
jgi:hypothetical protein